MNVLVSGGGFGGGERVGIPRRVYTAVSKIIGKGKPQSDRPTIRLLLEAAVEHRGQPTRQYRPLGIRRAQRRPRRSGDGRATRPRWSGHNSVRSA